MRVDSADRDPGARDSRGDQGVVTAPHRPVHQSGLDALHGVEDADVGGHVDDPQGGRGQHHRYLGCAGQVGQQFCVARVPVTRRVQRLLVQRGRADRADLALDGQPGGGLDIPVGGLAAYR
jgi:hypothetical protein